MFQNLPAELLHYIFMLLSPCTDLPNILNVCTRWRDACMEVLRQRQITTSEAYNLKGPLRWIEPSLSRGMSAQQSMPAKRFGSTLARHADLLYVFGGATSMFTTFNDLWVCDLNTFNWRRVSTEGEPPTPRAYAKGGFIGDTLYLYGGCHSFLHPGWHQSGRIEWLTDLNSFNVSRMLWTRVPLSHISHSGRVVANPLVNAGQSGCLLPADPRGQPSVLVIFGGTSETFGRCVNDLYIVNPERGQWLEVSGDSNASNASWPAGRCGHSTCALDSTRMLLLYGNLDSPIAPSTEQQAQDNQQIPVDNQPLDGGEAPMDERTRPLRGQPAGDIWMLTRCFSDATSQEWHTAHWYWTEIQCAINNPLGSPSLDFYHAVSIGMPFSDPRESTENRVAAGPSGEIGRLSAFTVLCISQPTAHILEEAVKQRRHWERQIQTCTSKSASVLSISPTTSGKLSPLIQSHSDSALDEPGSPTSSLSSRITMPSNVADRLSADDGVLPASSPSSPTSLPASRRSAERRARQLQALATQERRLFGSRNQLRVDRPNVSGAGMVDSSSRLNFPTKPLSVYTLRIQVCDPEVNGAWASPLLENPLTAVCEWLLPEQAHYLDLIHGPPECLGFSCIFSHDCIFLFGGLCESDEAVNDGNPAHLARDLPPIVVDNHQLMTQHVRSKSRNAQFFVLQPKQLVGTLV